MTFYTAPSLFDAKGNRKYLTQSERNRFLQAAAKAPPDVMTFCMVLAYTGARLSEVRALTPRRIDFGAQSIVVRCLKKRDKVVYRAIPVPDHLLSSLKYVHTLRYADTRLWHWCRTSAWSRVKEVMKEAGVSGICASPKGLRHAFGVSAVQSGVALNMLQKWMGHSKIETTAIYANAVGAEELAIAGKMWNGF